MAVVLVAVLLLAAIVGPAAAKDLVTIPIDRKIDISDNLDVDLEHITISDETYGASYVENPDSVLYPILVYRYENHGTAPDRGHLYVKLQDSLGNIYEKQDEGTMDMTDPGKDSGERLLEFNIPKNATVTELTVVQGFDETPIKLYYPGQATPASTGTPAGGSGTATPSSGSLGFGSALLPIAIVGLVGLLLAGRHIRKE